MDLNILENRLSRIEKNLLRATKEVLTLNEITIYTGLSKSHIKKLCRVNGLVFYKLNGKIYCINRLELENWLQQNRVATNTDKSKESIVSLVNKLKNIFKQKENWRVMYNLIRLLIWLKDNDMI